MNAQEFETKVLDFNSDQVINKLRSLGAIEIPEFMYKRYVFNLETNDIEWIRLRQGNSEVTMTYKYKVKGNVSIGKTSEIEVTVSDFDKTSQILHKLPFKDVFYQESKRHIFKHNDIEYSIDTWPMLEPHLEVESHSLEKVDEGLKVLDLEGKDVGDKDITSIYRERGIDMHRLVELKF
ncbi:MAG: CYTH domain-containing protein [bacterium]|nr:CYTH domain-containing protein [bacterium]